MPRRPRKTGTRRSGRRRAGIGFPLSRGFVLRGLVLLSATVVVALGVRMVLPFLAGLPLFTVDQVRLHGLTYLTEDDVRRTAGIDSTTNLWEPGAEWVRALEAHPLVESAAVHRRPPSTLAFEIREVVPVALVATPLVSAVDRLGNMLPLDPSRPVLDLPLLRVTSPDSAASWGIRVLAEEMARVADVAPEVFAVISEAHFERGLVTLHLGDTALRMHYAPPISEGRLREGIVAMNDALERFPDRPPREVDLRFDDQVVVRVRS